MAEPLAWGIGLGLLGAILGSFLATLVVRWPEGRSVVRGRSACDACGVPLRVRDLVPIVSAASLGGRCARCDAPITPVHTRLELAAAWIGTAAGVAAAGPTASAGAVFGWGLLTLAALDLVAWWLPDRLTLPLGALGLVLGQGSLTDRAIGGAAGFAVLWLIAWGYRRRRGREGLGGGDPKMLGAIGCWLGWAMLPAVLMVAGLIGLGAVAAMRLRGQAVARDTALPFGALLAPAAYLAWLAVIVLAP